MGFILIFVIGILILGIVVLRLPTRPATTHDHWYDPDIHAVMERVSDWFQNIARDALRLFLIWILHIYQRVGARVQLTGRIKKILRTHLYEHNRAAEPRQKSSFLNHLSHRHTKKD